MAHWGISYAAGPNYNLPWHLYDPAGKAQALATAYDAMQGALKAAPAATPVERALINALPSRYPQRDAIDDQSAWDKAFTREMRKVYAAHRGDLDVASVFAEAIMNETPWQMWDLTHRRRRRGGRDRRGGGRCSRSLFRDTPASWDHPGLLHLYVHLMEMSPFPERALRAGDRLRYLVPGRRATWSTCRPISTCCAGSIATSCVYNQKAVVGRPQVPRARRGAERLFDVSHPRPSLRDLRCDVPRPVHPGDPAPPRS